MTPVRRADPGDRAAVANVLDGAALAHEDLADRLREGDAFVFEADGPVLGALVLAGIGEADGTGAGSPAAMADTDAGTALSSADAAETGPRRIDAIAVRPRRRGQGIGTALVEAAAEAVGPLVAAFDDDLRPFYEQMGFEVELLEGGRCRGRLPEARDGSG